MATFSNSNVGVFPEQLRNEVQDKGWFGGSQHKIAFGDIDARFGPQTLKDVLTEEGLPATKLVKAIRKISSKSSSHFQSVTSGGRVDRVSVIGTAKLLDAIRSRSDEGTKVFVSRSEVLNSSSEHPAIGSLVFSIKVQFEGLPFDETHAREVLKRAEHSVCELEEVLGLDATHLVCSTEGILVIWAATKALPQEKWEMVIRKMHDIAIAKGIIASDSPRPKIDGSLVAPTMGKSKRPLDTHRLIKASDPIPLEDVVEAIESRHAALCSVQDLMEPGSTVVPVEMSEEAETIS